MKKILIAFILSVNVCHGQTHDEWFRQKKTAIKYLTDQIAAFQTYIGYAEKGYSVIKSGLNTINDIKQGDFSLHNTFYKGLSSVNPVVKKYSKVAAIIAMQLSIGRQIINTIKSCKKSNMLSSSEQHYLNAVFNNLLDECGKNLDQLITLITHNDAKMQDDERIKRIDLLYSDMKDKQMFATSFSHSAKGLTVQRMNDRNDIVISKKLNGL